MRRLPSEPEGGGPQGRVGLGWISERGLGVQGGGKIVVTARLECWRARSTFTDPEETGGSNAQQRTVSTTHLDGIANEMPQPTSTDPPSATPKRACNPATTTILEAACAADTSSAIQDQKAKAAVSWGAKVRYPYQTEACSPRQQRGPGSLQQLLTPKGIFLHTCRGSEQWELEI